MVSFTWIKYLFHGDNEPIEIRLPTSTIQQWIEDKKQIQEFRKLGVVLDFKEYNYER